MPGRGRSTFSKRQKEISRQEKRREKTARKQQRKLEKKAGFLETPGEPATPESSSFDESGSEDMLPPDTDLSR